MTSYACKHHQVKRTEAAWTKKVGGWMNDVERSVFDRNLFIMIIVIKDLSIF